MAGQNWQKVARRLAIVSLAMDQRSQVDNGLNQQRQNSPPTLRVPWRHHSDWVKK
jgi:hypothetical protein